MFHGQQDKLNAWWHVQLPDLNKPLCKVFLLENNYAMFPTDSLGLVGLHSKKLSSFKRKGWATFPLSPFY